MKANKEAESGKLIDLVKRLLDREPMKKELDKKSNQIAHFLRENCATETEERIGIFTTTAENKILAMLATLKAGAVSVPLSSQFSREELETIIRSEGIKTILCDTSHIELCNELQWKIEGCDQYLCIDTADVYENIELSTNWLMSEELWDHIGETAVDAASGGGWVSSYTGEAFSEIEMEEFSMNAYTKLEDSLHPDMKVLELGCASGYTLNKIAPKVALYYGTDLSSTIIEHTRKLLEGKGLDNVKLKRLAAHEIEEIEERDFDLIVINGVVQLFHGYNYLRKVIKDCIALLGDKGRIFIGDVMDLDKRDALVRELRQFKEDHKGKGYRTKTDFSSELFLSRNFFRDLLIEEEALTELSISDKIHTVENELTKFRYDLVVSVNKKTKTSAIHQKRKKQFGSTAFENKPADSVFVSVPQDIPAYLKYHRSTDTPCEINRIGLTTVLSADRPELAFFHSAMYPALFSFFPLKTTFDLPWQEEVQEKTWTYWKNTLADLSTDNSYHYTADYHYQLSFDTRDLSVFVQQTNFSFELIFLAVFKILLAKYNVREKAFLAKVYSNSKSLLQDADAYINTLPLSCQVDQHLSIKEYMIALQKHIAEAEEHAEVPLELICEKLFAASPGEVCDAVLMLHKTEDQEAHRMDVELKCFSNVLESVGIESFQEHFRSLLASIARQENTAIKELEYLSKQEQEQLLGTFNNNAYQYEELTVLDLFQQQVEQNPNKTALSFEGKNLSYGELDQLSNRLANYLKHEKKVQENSRIGVMVKRSLESVTGMLSILKAGACYVPIDLKYPKERVEYILEEADIHCILIDEKSWEVNNIETINLQELDLSECSGAPLPRFSQLTEPAFVIYTSGSTGKPKGVVQTHQMLSNLIQWEKTFSGIDAGLNYLQYTSFCFDVSVQDCWFSMCYGGTLFILSEQERMNFPQLINIIETNKIQVLSLPFTVLQTLYSDSYVHLFGKNHIKHLISSGEQLVLSETLKEYLRQNPGIQLHNHYGPSETHVVSAHTISGTNEELPTYVPIGKPISNTKVYLLDKYKNLLPLGLKGEVYLGGKGLALGYLNNEERTRELFISNPLTKDGKVYKTGDLAYWKKDGTLVFEGRIDSQVKIRGHRIELKEIESILRNHETIENCALSIRENAHQEKEIIAYLTCTEELSAKVIRDFLRQSLPDYMVPAAFFRLEAFPLTSNGKLDKRALRHVEAIELSDNIAYVAPANALENKLVEIWSNTLELDAQQVGIKEEFLGLGGNSLLAVKVINVIREELDLNLSMATFFAYDTIERLSAYIHLMTNEEDQKEVSVLEI
jgi:amino acid adenylation domain-containing protein